MDEPRMPRILADYRGSAVFSERKSTLWPRRIGRYTFPGGYERIGVH